MKILVLVRKTSIKGHTETFFCLFLLIQDTEYVNIIINKIDKNVFVVMLNVTGFFSTELMFVLIVENQRWVKQLF